ncbi:MAG TPA: erythromycin esterase family protein [Tepidisphaeraceae bacterium]|jgi:erythromycin esterase-like protein
MSETTAQQTLDEWIAKDAVAFSLDEPHSFNSAVDRIVSALGDSVELLGFGEALHGGEEILLLRNRLFQRLVENHGYTAITIESSFPRGVAVDDYIGGRGAASYDAVAESGFSHGFGKLEANRELIEWMRVYNADAAHPLKLRFYGFDSPTEMMATDSPRQLLTFALDYLDRVSSPTASTGAPQRRQRVQELLGSDADWENPAAMMDPSKSVGGSAAAISLRIEAEELIGHLHLRRPEFIRSSGRDDYLQALQHALVARQFLNYHATLARATPERMMELLGIRDVIIGDNLVYAAERERGRGKVFAFGHNAHLKRGQMQWQLGPHALAWWPGGAHASEMLRERYAVIGTGVGTSEQNGIVQPQANTLEALLAGAPGPVRFLPTRRGEHLFPNEIQKLNIRSTSPRNSTYFPFTSQSLTDFDALTLLDAVTYTRGGPALPPPQA